VKLRYVMGLPPPSLLTFRGKFQTPETCRLFIGIYEMDFAGLMSEICIDELPFKLSLEAITPT
jgi:hypothetical protein